MLWYLDFYLSKWEDAQKSESVDAFVVWLNECIDVPGSLTYIASAPDHQLHLQIQICSSWESTMNKSTDRQSIVAKTDMVLLRRGLVIDWRKAPEWSPPSTSTGPSQLQLMSQVTAASLWRKRWRNNELFREAVRQIRTGTSLHYQHLI